MRHWFSFLPTGGDHPKARQWESLRQAHDLAITKARRTWEEMEDLERELEALASTSYTTTEIVAAMLLQSQDAVHQEEVKKQKRQEEEF